METVVNPLITAGADPWFTRSGDLYYYCHTGPGNRICIRASRTLAGMAAAEPVDVWAAPAGTAWSRNIWAPELHHLDGRWYIYFAADDGHNENHRMYVLAGPAGDPLAPFEFAGKVSDPEDRWAIDGTVVDVAGGRYFVWSGWEGAVNGQQNLYIAPMKNPLELAAPRTVISTPTYPWERVGDPLVNEGPQALRRGGRLFVIYSASGSWTDDYCLGQLEYRGGDPASAASWEKEPAPVFRSTDEVFGPGHASFVDDGAGAWWIVYHAARHQGAGWDREVRAQPFGWHADGKPRFGSPVPPGVPVG